MIVRALSVLALSGCAKPGSSEPAPDPATGGELLLGVITPDFLDLPEEIDRQIGAMDRWTKRPTTFAGLFLDIDDPNPAYNLYTPFSALTENGYTVFLHITSRRTLADIDLGNGDDGIRGLAHAAALWARQHESGLALISPLTEMNGTWESYSGSPEEYHRVFRRFRRIFDEEGVPRERLRWVFAPNGWSPPGRPFEDFYPGADLVDVVGFSAYNWGYCNGSAWDTAHAAFAPYLDQMVAMAPGKPIMVTQMGCTSETAAGADQDQKDDWLQEAYQLLISHPDVLGSLYFNLDKECDWAVYRDHGPSAAGYRKATRLPGVSHATPADIARRIEATDPDDP